MGKTTGIAWTDKTWNPWQGCHKVSAGCTNCYMHSEKKRYGQDPGVVIRSKPPTFNAPMKWADPARVFTCSWSDFFIEEADAWRPEAWEIIRATPHLTYQILTKRPERIVQGLPADWGDGWPNVWLGVTIEHQEDAARRAAWLLEIPAAVRFVSCEPLLEGLDLTNLEYIAPSPPHAPGVWLDALRGHVKGPDDMLGTRIDWAICGGESGPGARPCDLAWIRSIVEQCRAAGTKCFVKQLGAHPVSDHGMRPGALRDRAGADPAEWPEDIQVREFPTRKP